MSIFPTGRYSICQTLQNFLACLGMFQTKLSQFTTTNPKRLYIFDCNSGRRIFLTSNDSRPTKEAVFFYMRYRDRTSIVWLERHIHDAAGDQIKKFCWDALLKNSLACLAGKGFKQRSKQTNLFFGQLLKNSYFI